MKHVETTIRRVSDGAQVVRHEEVPDEYADGVLFIWEDGNYSCDCNRGNFFYDEMPEDDPEAILWDIREPKCGDGAFRVCVRLSGAVIYDELEGA